MTRLPFQCLPILRGLRTPDVGACGIPLSDLTVPLILGEIAQHFLYRDSCSREGLSGECLSLFPARVTSPGLAACNPWQPLVPDQVVSEPLSPSELVVFQLRR